MTLTNIKILSVLALITLLFSCENNEVAQKQKVDSPASHSEEQGGKVTILPVSEVNYDMLNPARGDASPLAGTLWGDRNAEVPTGFLAKFPKGFSSPPHVHNVTYRAVVIEGLLHNDDPKAANMWMPVGSFWTQPAGEAHITSANGTSNLALVEIDHGPYLVKPIDEAEDNGERPVNIDASNLVWTSLAGESGAKIAYLWGDPESEKDHGIFIKLPSTFKGLLSNTGQTFRAVVIKGGLEYGNNMEKQTQALLPGSYFSTTAKSSHVLQSQEGCVIYIRTNGSISVTKA